MPRIKPSEREEANRLILACIASNMVLYKKSEGEISTAAGFSLRTYYTRMSNPETFSLVELQRIGKVLKFTPIQCASIMLGRAMTSKEVKEFILL